MNESIVRYSKTGYFARAAGERGLREYIGNVHLVCGGNPICGNNPPRTARFHWCSNGPELESVDCDKCKKAYAEALSKWASEIKAGVK